MQQAKFCPQCGALLQEAQFGDRMRPVCPACGYIHYVNPVVAAGTLVEERERVALIKRGVDPRSNTWGLPAGYVEADETAEEAAIRETREESGLDVALDDLLGVYSFGSAEQMRGVLILYAAHTIGGELHAGDDALDARYFAPNELPPDDQISFWTHRKALHDWRRARAVTYRAATEAEAIVAMEINLKYGQPPRDFLTIARQDASVLLIATDGQAIVGYATLAVDLPGETVRLDNVFVLPASRRWGIGTRLLTSSLDYARRRGVKRLITELDASNPAIVVYLKAGFRICGYLDLSLFQQPTATNPVLFLTYRIGD